MEKKCSDCKVLKSVALFNKNKHQSLGYSNLCKICSSARNKIRQAKLKEEIYKGVVFPNDNEKKCNQCNTIKPKIDFNKNKAKKDGVYSMCSVCRRKIMLVYKSDENKILYLDKDLLNERWLDVTIDGVKFPYRISDCGRVWLNGRQRMANPSFDQFGYPQIVLSNKKKRVGRRVHILVATHFIGNPEQLSDVNHKDGVKAYPHYSNLEWATSKQNAAHAYKIGLRKGFDSKSHPNSKKVIDTATGKIYHSITEAQTELGISHLAGKLKGWIINKTTLRYYKP